jgi:ribose transport system ATP-binding protein
LIRHPRMLVLDEPTAMLSEAEKRRLYAVLSKLRAQGKTLALITHHVEDVEALADDVTIMRDGCVVDSFAARGGFDSKQLAEKLGGVRSALPHDATTQTTPKLPFLHIQGLRDRDDKPTPLEVKSGDIVGLYGVAGCGAEYVVNALAGLCPTGRLQVSIDETVRVIRNPARARQLGIAHLPTGRASSGIFPTRSIRENLNVTQLSQYSRAGLISRRREALGTRLQLGSSAVKYEDIDQDIMQLSGGNQQKILLSRVLRSGSRLLVLEDPTAGIDIEAKREIQEAIRARAAEGVAIILISSDLTETIDIVSTLYTLYAGRIMSCYSVPEPQDRAAIVADVIGQCPGSGRSSAPRHTSHP